jgi:hypothetical protein
MASPQKLSAAVAASSFVLPGSRQLLDVVHQAVQAPLCTRLLLAPEGEAVQSLGVPDIGEDRLHRGHALAVDRATACRFDRALHQFRGHVPASRADGEYCDLPHRRTLRMAQTPCSLGAAAAACLRALVL